MEEFSAAILAGPLVILHGIGAVGQDTGLGKAAAIHATGLHIGRPDGEKIRQIVIVRKGAPHVDGPVNNAQPRRIDGRIAILQGNGAWHAAYHIVGVRVLPSEHHMGCHQLALLVQHFQIMRHGHEVHLRREQLIIGMVPPLGGKDAQLAAVHNGLHLVLDGCEILGRRRREIMGICLCIDLGSRPRQGKLVGIEHRVLKVCRSNGIRRQCLHRAYPIQGMQMVEMYDMILHRKRCRHDIADIVGILGNLDAQGILHRPD